MHVFLSTASVLLAFSSLAAFGCSENFVVDRGDGGLSGSGPGGAATGGGSNGTGSGTSSGSASGSGGGKTDAPVDCTIDAPGCVIDWAGTFGEPIPFNGLSGITADASNVYVTHQHQVSSVNVATGLVTSIAGTGAEGDSSGIGEIARFASPSGIVVYEGSLFVSVRANSGGLPKIKRINIATKAVTDYVYNNSILKEPRGLAIQTGSTNPQLLIVDAGNHTVVRVAIDDVAPAPAVIAGTNTVAGDGDKNLNGPTDIAVLGSVAYIADRGNNKIRAIDLTITPTAGNPIPVTDVWGDGSAGFAEGSGSDAILNLPSSLSVAGENLVVADSGNRVLRGGKPDGELTLVAGTPGNQKHQIGGGKNAGFDADSLYVFFHEKTSHTFIVESQVVRRMSPP